MYCFLKKLNLSYLILNFHLIFKAPNFSLLSPLWKSLKKSNLFGFPKTKKGSLGIGLFVNSSDLTENVLVVSSFKKSKIKLWSFSSDLSKKSTLGNFLVPPSSTILYLLFQAGGIEDGETEFVAAARETVSFFPLLILSS